MYFTTKLQSTSNILSTERTFIDLPIHYMNLEIRYQTILDLHELQNQIIYCLHIN